MVPLDPPPPVNRAKFSFGGAFIKLIIPATNQEGKALRVKGNTP
jgi:hypothetical protein